MSVLLAIDTSAGTSVAIVDAGRVLAERSSSGRRGHAELIGRFIADVIDDAGIVPSDVDGVAIGMGPGPFTGLRVGIAAARAFAFGIGRPVLPIASHDAVAFAQARVGTAERIVVVTDARRGEVAWTAYAAPDAAGLPVPLADPALAAAPVPASPAPVSPPAASPKLPEWPLRTSGSDPSGSFGDGSRRVDAAEIPAGDVGLLAEALLREGRALAADEPLYLRAPDVTLSAPKRVSG